MNSNKALVKVKFHGDLASIFNSEWRLDVASVSEAINAINILTDHKLNNYLSRKDKLNAKYRILINGKDFRSPVSNLDASNVEMVNQTNLVYKIDNLETIDIVPFIDNNDSKTIGALFVVAGVILIIVGLATGLPFIAVAGLALVMGGVAALLARPPEFLTFRNVDKFGNESYLFGGPTNVIGEGGPVPIGYGSLIVGSQVITSAYTIEDYQTFRS